MGLDLDVDFGKPMIAEKAGSLLQGLWMNSLDLGLILNLVVDLALDLVLDLIKL